MFRSFDGAFVRNGVPRGSDNTLEAFSKVRTPLYMSPEVLRGKVFLLHRVCV